MNKNIVIGVLGGMGTYATIHLFQQYAHIFQAEKEWERPRIVIDNRCTMPSRVRAFLYNENVNMLIDEMADSMQGLIRSGCNRIILACNTSHLFLPWIFQKYPELEKSCVVVNIIYNCINQINIDGLREVYLLGSEGTIESSIYQDALQKYNIKCVVPRKNEYTKIRKCIESVKQNKYTEETKKEFINLILSHENCILGCTELPILYEKYYSELKSKKVYDPLWLALEALKEEYENE